MPTRNPGTSLARETAHDSPHDSPQESAQQWAHELRQPLSAILSNAQAALRLLAHEGCVGEVREILEDIVACDKRAALILRRLEEAQRSALAGGGPRGVGSEDVARRAGRTGMSISTGTLYIVDDDLQARAGLARLLRSAGYQTRTFGSAAEFLDAHAHLEQAPGCLILDLAMPEMSGLELQQALCRGGCRRPIVFLSGKSDISKSVRAMKGGAVNFLTKPVDARELFAAVEEALSIDAAERSAWIARHGVVERIATLTPRERQVLGQLVSGKINKQIAAALGTAEKTVKVHRSRVMRKMHAGSIVELVKLTSLVDIQSGISPALPAETALAAVQPSRH